MSLIKTTLALEHGEIPPTLGYEKPNPAINFAASPFLVCDRLTPWPATNGPRRAGVNSLGVGGTNAHAVLEQAPARQPAAARADGEGPHLLVLSAKSRKALDDSSRRLADFLASNADAALPDVASTLFHGRTHFAHRRVVAARDRAQAVSILRATDRNAAAAHTLVEKASGAVFLFPAAAPSIQGWHGRSIAKSRLSARPSMRALAICPPTSPRRSVPYGSTTRRPTRRSAFCNPALQLPAILITEIAIARLWMSWGIKPDRADRAFDG